MVHRPKRSSVFGNRDLDGDQRQQYRTAGGNQNLTPGRYDVKEEARQGTQRALSKAKRATQVTIDPEVSDAIGRTYN